MSILTQHNLTFQFVLQNDKYVLALTRTHIQKNENENKNPNETRKEIALKTEIALKFIEVIRYDIPIGISRQTCIFFLFVFNGEWKTAFLILF